MIVKQYALKERGYFPVVRYFFQETTNLKVLFENLSRHE